MYSCTRKDNNTLFFVNQETGKTCSIVFPTEDMLEKVKIFGFSGKELSRKPTYAKELVLPALKVCRGYNEIAIAVRDLTSNNNYVTKINHYLIRLNNEGQSRAERFMRYFESVGLTYNEDPSMYVNMIWFAGDTANVIQHRYENKTKRQEVESLILQYLNELEGIREKYHFIRLHSVPQMERKARQALLKQRISNIMPAPYRNDPTAQEILDYLFHQLDEEFLKLSTFSAICQGFKTNALQNLWVIHNSSNCPLNVSRAINTYLRRCRNLERQPRFVSNFIKEYADVTRMYDAAKDDLFAKKQTEKPLSFSAYGYTVIVPLTVQDLVVEGERQHNCVGSYGYDRRVIEGHSNIVFVRKENDPTTPVVTCEITSSGVINQFLTSHNRKPENCYLPEIKRFRQKYQEYLQTIF